MAPAEMLVGVTGAIAGAALAFSVVRWLVSLMHG